VAEAIPSSAKCLTPVTSDNNFLCNQANHASARFCRFNLSFTPLLLQKSHFPHHRLELTPNRLYFDTTDTKRLPWAILYTFLQYLPRFIGAMLK